MASKRFLIVPEDSSAASMPLPGATRARATLLRSARFIDASSRALFPCRFLAGQNRRFSGDSQAAGAGRGEAGGSLGSGGLSRDLRIEFALGITRRHLGGGQHFLELAG